MPAHPARVDAAFCLRRLTDPEIRENYEKYGHPVCTLAWKRSASSLAHVGWPAAQDGRQAMTGAIGLPEFFMDESKWQLILIVYFGALIFGLPIMVWRW